MSVGPSTLTHLLAREPLRHGPSQAQAQQSSQWFESDPNWFKRAVFYEIHMRGFFDANGDGSGDFRGLTEKLEYLQWLGIDCIWLLPFFQSPMPASTASGGSSSNAAAISRTAISRTCSASASGPSNNSSS